MKASSMYQVIGIAWQMRSNVAAKLPCASGGGVGGGMLQQSNPITLRLLQVPLRYVLPSTFAMIVMTFANISCGKFEIRMNAFPHMAFGC